ncbi:hypothetical protein GQ55_3G229300 [Panicum hallii var. hallii]|uniref:WRKY domain-containing protein n=1 Tax=Panicum hallii var. hallii TaxID=1504633 RepID=A0A2T7ECF6_9POAL|nr:hypothetical protein GQ55_3G229300 [Panicum hallii var. hallii]
MAAMAAPATAASELVAKGRKSAAFLRSLLGQQPAVGAGAAPHGLQDLAEQILRCCDRALAALRAATEDAAAASSARKRRNPEQGAVPTPATSSNSKRMRLSGGERATRAEKRRTMEDGFVWRKYGQKDIHGSKHPRLYFRCTYKDDHGCMARRQVQRSEADPSVYLINYFGEHTCCRGDDVAESPAPFVINFGASTRDGQQLIRGSPWSSSCDEGGGLVVSETSDLCHSPEEKELRAGMGDAAELISEQSTPPPVPELTSMSSPEWHPLDGYLVCDDIGLGESLFDDIGEFAPLDYVGLFQ